MPEPLVTCPVCGGPMAVKLEVLIFDEGTAGYMPAFWKGTRQRRCSGCTFVETMAWTRPDWRVPTERAELADIHGAVEVLCSEFDNLIAPSVKRRQRIKRG